MNSFPSHWQYQQARRYIYAGGVLAYPTEAVFGLGCDPSNAHAIQRILQLKHRDPGKGMILVASNMQQLEPWIEPLSATKQSRLMRTWPGPITWLVPAAKHCPEILTGAHSTLAIRISAHPVVQQLCNTLGHALVSTSANLSKQTPARSTLRTRLIFGDHIDYLLSGQVGNENTPTSIYDLATGKEVRA